jgi:hypothetical protein
VNLHDHMAELAEDVRPVDLRDRIVAQSQRSTTRRRIVAGTAASVVAVALVSGIAWAKLPAPRNTVVTPASPTQSMQRATLPAKIFYLANIGGGRHTLKWLDGTTARNLFTPSTPACGLTVSPDGREVAWVTADGGGAAGFLRVASPEGTGARTLLEDVSCTPGTVPRWMPAGRSLLVTRADDASRVTVDTDNGSVGEAPLYPENRFLAVSPNGKMLAYEEGGEIVVARPGGEVLHRAAHADETPTGGFSVQGVTNDGTRVVVGLRTTDPDQVRTGFRLVDVVTGENVSLPAGVAPADPARAAIYPARGNRLIVRAEGRVHLLAPDLTVLDTRTEPADLRTATLLPTE